MQPISSFISGATAAASPASAASTVSAAGIKEPQAVPRPESTNQERPVKPVMDEYVPEEKPEPSGRYWPGKDEDGKPKIYFDDPEQDRKASGSEEERCTCNTDKVDREIEKLKKEQEKLERQLSSAANHADNEKIRELERKLAQIESQLRQKDNDTYRRQHAEFS